MAHAPRSGLTNLSAGWLLVSYNASSEPYAYTS